MPDALLDNPRDEHAKIPGQNLSGGSERIGDYASAKRDPEGAPKGGGPAGGVLMLGVVSSRREGESALDPKPDDTRCRVSSLAGDSSPSQVTGRRVPGGSKVPDAATTTTVEESVCSSAVKAVIDTDAPLVAALTGTGRTATTLVKYRSRATTLGASANGSEIRRLPCVRGVVSATEVASSAGTDFVITEA